jgi:hypothetical protein
MKNIYNANLNCGSTAAGKINSNIGKPKKKLVILPAIKIKWLSIFMLIAGFSCLSNTVFAQQVAPGIVPMMPPTGGLDIEGNLRANTPTAGKGDWLPGTGGTGMSVLNAAGVPIDADITYHSVDLFVSGDDVFNGGQKKNDNPNSMTWRRANPSPAKCDINHFLMHVAEDPNTNHTWIAISGDRQVTNGNSFISLQFLQKTLTQVPDNKLTTLNGTFQSDAPNSTGGRTVGDLQVSAEFLNGGGNPNLYLERWELSGGVYKWVAYNFFQTHPNAAYGATNSAALSTTGNYSVFGASNFSYTANAFLEAAIDITEIVQAVGSNDCLGRISTLWVMTKSSQSETANMTDFVTPLQINLDINVTADAGPDKAYCAGGSTTIGTAAEAGVTYSWTPATGLSATNVAQPTANPASTTDYILTITKTGSNCSSKDTVTVTVNPNPTITGLSIGDICAGTMSASLAYTGITGSPNQYKIDWDDAANLAGLADVDYTTLPASPISISGTGSVVAGTYSGTIYVKDSNTACESAGAGISLKINPNPVLSITNPAGVCAPGKVDLTAAAVTAGSTLPTGTTLSYWTNADGTGAVADPTMVGTGTYYIKATTNTTPACSDIKAVVATVNATPVLVITNPAAVCAPNTVSLTAAAVTAGSTLPTGTTLSYLEADGTTPVATPGAVGVGTYYIKATTNTSPACSDTELVTVSVKEKPARPVVTITEATLCDTVSAPKLEVLCPEAGTYTLTQTGVQGSKGFVYNGTNGPVIFRNLKAGKGFSITLTIDGCVSDPTNCDNKSNLCPVPEDDRQTKPKTQGSVYTKEMKAYPIPFYDNVTIQFTSDKDEDYVVNLYDVQGRLVKELKAGHSRPGEVMQIEVDGTQLAGNFYVARKISRSGVSIVKLLKAK